MGVVDVTPASSPVTAAQTVAQALGAAAKLAQDQRYGEADVICGDVLAQAPDYIPAVGLRGAIAALRGDAASAIPLLERACAGDGANFAWRATLGELYRSANRLDEALERAQQAVRLNPRHAGNLITLAKVKTDLGEAADGATLFLAALAVEPDNASAHLGIGQVLLARGEFRPGWIEYEWRNKLPQAKGRMPPINAPQWNGMRLDRDRILLVADQGFGDALQFARYIPMVAARCQEVVLACGKELLPLLAKLPGVGRTYQNWQDIPTFTAYALLSSLPYVFGTDLSTIPRDDAYITADAGRVEAWRAKLSAAGMSGRRVGLFWAGRPEHPNDGRRSIPLATMLPFGRVPNLTLVSLQKDVPAKDADLLARSSITAVGGALTDFGETAALIQDLDLVITVDSAVAHLAGATGRPTWVLTPTPADWRWLRDRSDSPWYASMRLFRQRQPGDWDGVIADVVDALTVFSQS